MLPAEAWQVAWSNHVVAPTSVVGDVIDPARKLVAAYKDGGTPSDDEARALVGAATAISVSGPGFGTHLEVARGLGAGFEVSARVGNGIYGAGLRYGVDGEAWDAALGARLAYNSGSSMVPFFDDLNGFVNVAGMSRVETQLVFAMGKDLGDVFKLWLGLKGISSSLDADVNASAIGLGKDKIDDRINTYGSFVGLALGYRWLHAFAELALLYSVGGIEVFGTDYDLSGIVIAPAWGLQITF